MTDPVSAATAAHYVWGVGCDGWRLVDHEGLSVIEELVPPGASETWHSHATARQFFFILEGRATLLLAGSSVDIQAGEGIEVPPGIAHRFTNSGDGAVRFLVISAPSTAEDRVQLDNGER